MRIGIDARMHGPHVGGGGLGRYVEQLARELPRVDRTNRYVLIQPDIPWYTLQEQLQLGRYIDRLQLDLVHFPHWNVPIRIRTPFVVSIHDLILLEQPRSARATTRHPLMYALKYAGFKRVLSHALHRSQKIIAVSQATKSDILTHFPTLREEKIVVIYEGVTPLPQTDAPAPVPRPYLLYVGNAYPHKNLEALLDAFTHVHRSRTDMHLVFAGRRDVFQERLQKRVENHPSKTHIHFVQNPDDATLSALYRNAQAYVFPSRIEGFGLPALEAMSAGVPVLCSDIPSLREVLGEAATYFPADKPEHIASAILNLLNDPHAQAQQKQRGHAQAAKYQWKRMAEEIVHVYQTCERP